MTMLDMHNNMTCNEKKS